MKPYAVLAVVLAFGSADRTPANNDGCTTVYCPETWCYRDGECRTGALSRPMFEAPTLRPDFRERILQTPRRKLYRPARDVTE